MPSMRSRLTSTPAVRRGLTGALTLLAFGASASAAEASTFGLGLVGPSYLAADGEQNNVTLSLPAGGTQIRATEAQSAMVVGAGLSCTVVAGSTNKVDCPGADHPIVFAQLFDKDDFFDGAAISTAHVYVDGGTGNDTMTTGISDDVLGGAAGNDIANGGGGNDTYADEVAFSIGFGAIHSDGAGNDTFNGNSGNDTMNAGADATTDGNGIGADTFNGGADVDTADYSARTSPIAVTVDAGVGNDGAPGEGDTITGVERVLGGSAADQLTAGTAASTLVGASGSDTLTGGAAADRLVGGDVAGDAPDGDDTLDGAAGADILIGGRGRDTATYASRTVPVTVTVGDGANDGAAGEQDDVRDDVERIVGGSAGDTLTGDDGANALLGAGGGDLITPADGADTVDAGPGDDRIEARDLAQDAIVCGDGIDTVIADATDIVAGDCETVDRPATPAGEHGTGNAGGATGTTGAGGGTTSPAPIAPVVIATKALKRTAGKRVAVKVGCPGTHDCAGDLRLTLDKGARSLVTLRYGVPAGQTRSFVLTLSAAARKKLKSGQKNAVTLSVSRTGAASAQLKGKI